MRLLILSALLIPCTLVASYYTCPEAKYFQEYQTDNGWLWQPNQPGWLSHDRGVAYYNGSAAKCTVNTTNCSLTTSGLAQRPPALTSAYWVYNPAVGAYYYYCVYSNMGPIVEMKLPSSTQKSSCQFLNAKQKPISQQCFGNTSDCMLTCT